MAQINPGYRKIGFSLTAAIFLLSIVVFLYPGNGESKPNLFGPDKLAHIAAYFLMLLPALSVAPRIWVWLVPAAICYGILIEFIQPFFGRGFDVADMVANAIGAFAAIPVARSINKRLSQTR